MRMGKWLIARRQFLPRILIPRKMVKVLWIIFAGASARRHAIDAAPD